MFQVEFPYLTTLCLDTLLVFLVCLCMVGIIIMINSRLTKGVVVTPLLCFPGHTKTLKKVTKGIKVISFTSFVVIFIKKKKLRVPPYSG